MTEGKNHTKALYVTVECKRVRIPMVLVDNGSAINVCPLRVAKRLGLSSKNLTPSTQIVRAYDNTKREVAGVFTVEAKVGPVVANVEFHVLDIPASFNLLLGRPWLHGLWVLFLLRYTK